MNPETLSAAAAEPTVITATERSCEATGEARLVTIATDAETVPVESVTDANAAPINRRVFRTNELLSGMSDAAFDRFIGEVEIVRFAPDQVIFEEGAPGDCVYLIARGAVKISKKGRGGQQETLTYLSAGDFFGEMALVDDGIRSAQATAHDECILGRIDENGWALLFQVAANQVLANFTRAITKRLRQNNQHFIDEMMRNERLSMLGSTVSSIVHDMNNPLSCILSASEILRAHTRDPVVTRMSTMIRDAVGRMEVMTRELVEFSRGTTRLDVRPTSVSELLDGLEHEFQECRAANIDVQMDVQDPGELQLDGQRMLRVLANLVRNAREAMQTSGGQVRLRVDRRDDADSFEVTETGCGIAAEVLPRIFEPFVTHGKAHGTGLGLAISKSIVDAHGGHISVQSTENAGTTFLITIPFTPPREP